MIYRNRLARALGCGTHCFVNLLISKRNMFASLPPVCFSLDTTDAGKGFPCRCQCRVHYWKLFHLHPTVSLPTRQSRHVLSHNPPAAITDFTYRSIVCYRSYSFIWVVHCDSSIDWKRNHYTTIANRCEKHSENKTNSKHRLARTAFV